MKANWVPTIAACLFAFFLCLLAGCATSDVTPEASSPGSGVEEYRRLASESAAAVHSALSRLEQVGAQVGQCPRKILTEFAEQVDQLQIESIRVRARVQAIQARGDRYFEAWVEDIKISNGKQHPDRFEQLRESFVKIKQTSQEAGQAFRPFLTGLRTLRMGLEADPAVIETPETKELVRKTRENGWQVLQKLGILREELQAFRAEAAQVKPASGI